MSGAALRFKDVGKRFRVGPPVLSGLDLEVAPGSFLAVVGRSGAGKSTLLRLALGLDAPSSGVVEGPAPGEARLVFQEPRLLPWERVRGNVALGLAGAGDPRRAEQALAQVGLADRADAWPDALSGGQGQRVALARALVSSPRFLALDEPLGALDALTRIEMQALVERVWREQAFTALLVTHDVAEAVTLADRVILLDRGAVRLDLAVNLPRPRDRGAADFGERQGRLLSALLASG